MLDYPGGPSVITRVHIRKRQGRQNQREGRCEQKSELCALKMKEGVMSQGIQPLEAGKGKGMEPPEEMQPCQHLDFRTSDLQNCQIIPLCHCKPLSVW